MFIRWFFSVSHVFHYCVLHFLGDHNWGRSVNGYINSCVDYNHPQKPLIILYVITCHFVIVSYDIAIIIVRPQLFVLKWFKFCCSLGADSFRIQDQKVMWTSCHNTGSTVSDVRVYSRHSIHRKSVLNLIRKCTNYSSFVKYMFQPPSTMFIKDWRNMKYYVNYDFLSQDVPIHW